MRNLAAQPELLSLNTATVRERWGLLEIVEGCARHGIRANDHRHDSAGPVQMICVPSRLCLS